MSSVRRTDSPRPPSVSPLFDRAPPFDPEAEIAVLGSIMLLPDVCDDVALILRTDDFHDDAHRKIYQHMLDMHESGRKIDPTLLVDKLKTAGDYESIGGAAYLGKILHAVPNAAHAIYYAEIVREKSTFRRLIEASTEILREAYEESTDATQLVARAEQRVFSILDERGGLNVSSMQDILHEAMDRLEARMRGELMHGGVETGYGKLDEQTGGLHNSELIVLAARPSMGKCLSADAEVVLADGSMATMEQIVQRQSAELLTLRADWKLGWTQPSAFIDDGIKPVFRVTTRLGRTITTTLTHPFLTVDGWRPLGELAVGANVAVPRSLAVFGSQPLGEHRVKLLGYLLGDGGLTNANPRFTNSSALLRDDFRSAIDGFGGLRVRENSSGGTRTVTLSVAADADDRSQHRTAFGERLAAAMKQSRRSDRKLASEVGVTATAVLQWRRGQAAPDSETLIRVCDNLGVPVESLAADAADRLQKNAPNRLTRWLAELGVYGCDARQKFVPACVFRCPKPELALFLNRLFATDGWATVLTSGQSQLGYCSVSRRLASQVQHLLLRFGVIASLKPRSVKYREGRRQAWQLDITDAESIRTFSEEIGIFGKEEALARVADALDNRRYQTNRDLIPREVWQRLNAARGSRSWASITATLGYGPGIHLHVGRRALSRSRLWQLATVLGDGELQRLAASDVYWDQIVSIESLGEQQVYDLTIPDTHNFIANDVCVHNTAFAMCVAANVAIRQQVPVLFVSLEMSAIELAERLLCCEARVNGHRLRNGTIAQDDRMRLVETSGEISRAPLFVDDSPGRTVTEIAAAARRIRRREGKLGLIVIDYLQLVEPDNPKDPRQEQVSRMTRRLKGLAREMEVPVMCLAQLNRQTEQAKDNIPRLSHLRESGAIEQDADVVMFVHREEYYARGEDAREMEGKAQIIVAKQRNGPIGDIDLAWLRDFTRFENLADNRYEGEFNAHNAQSSGAGF